MVNIEAPYRSARAEDARSLARLIDRASEGISSYLWGLSAKHGQDPLEIGTARAARPEGGFSFTNAVVYERDGAVGAMLLGYRLDDPYELPDPSGLPDLVVPLLELEAQAPGSWYVNAIAVEPSLEGQGIGRALMDLAEQLGRDTSAPEMSLIVADQNTRAKTLYERVGYRERDRRTLPPVEGLEVEGDFVLMVKPL